MRSPLITPRNDKQAAFEAGVVVLVAFVGFTAGYALGTLFSLL